MRFDLHTPSAALALATALVAVSSSADRDGLKLHSGVDAGFGWAGEDGFALVLLEQGLAYEGVGLVLSGPLRFRIIDDAPEEDGVLRDQDWDEPSDFARIARRVAFAKTWDDAELDARLGELNGVGVGHGSVADHYFNSADMDHYQGGLILDAEYAGNGIEFLMDDVVAPEILAGRARIAPLAWFLDGDWPRRLEIGYTLGADIKAPRRVMGNSDTVIAVTGGDVSLRVVDLDVASLIPYADVMGMDGDVGVHAGLAASFTFSRKDEAALRARGEYRHLGSDYHPALLNPFYDRSRRFYSRDPVDDRTNTFADHLANPNTADASSHGWMADAAFSFRRAIEIGARFDSEGRGRPHWLLVRVALSPMERFDLHALYAGRDGNGAGDVLSADALVGLGTRILIWGPFNVFAEYARRFRRKDGEMPYANESGVGIGMYFAY
ncbi:MAG: hypothetical protein M0R80_11875 [Proteobacteria bacterium]|nr:hypothetical protein [Pseudomonadota bacterium]